MYKVFINNREIRFINQQCEYPETRLQNYKDLDKSLLNQLINELFHSEGSEPIEIQAKNPLIAFSDFINRFTVVEASGGLVKNEKNEYLFIYRREMWDLPKGHIDAGETPEVTALREIEEETGVVNLSITEKLPETYHMYQYKNKWLVKRNYWFRCNTNSGQKLNPQMEEDIDKVEWLNKDEVKSIRPKAWPSLYEIIDIACKD